ncbi:MAG: DMT family transporter [Spirochaetales bacterium]|nr:DMT family transporter [Spirochaetales bacterium]
MSDYSIDLYKISIIMFSMDTRKKSILADFMILSSALLWGGEYVVVKDVLDYLSPCWVNAFRFIAASLLMLPIFWRNFRNVSKKEVFAGFILGVFLFAGFTLQTVGLVKTTAGKSGFLTASYVVMVPFLVWLLKKEFPGFKALICAGILISGIALLSLDMGGGFNQGDLLTIIAAVSFACGIIGFDIYSKKYDPINLTILEMFTGGLLALVVAAFLEPVPNNISFGGKEILQLVYLVVFGSIVCHLLSNVALKWTNATHASILWSLESVFAMVFGILFLGEGMTLRIGIGFSLVLAAVLLTELGGKSK